MRNRNNRIAVSARCRQTDLLQRMLVQKKKSKIRSLIQNPANDIWRGFVLHRLCLICEIKQLSKIDRVKISKSLTLPVCFSVKILLFSILEKRWLPNFNFYIFLKIFSFLRLCPRTRDETDD
jgi:hypothetical protein